MYFIRDERELCVSQARNSKRRKSSRANAGSKLLVLGLGDAVLGKVGINGETRSAFPHSEQRSEGRGNNDRKGNTDKCGKSATYLRESSSRTWRPRKHERRIAQGQVLAARAH